MNEKEKNENEFLFKIRKLIRKLERKASISEEKSREKEKRINKKEVFREKREKVEIENGKRTGMYGKQEYF